MTLPTVRPSARPTLTPTGQPTTLDNLVLSISFDGNTNDQSVYNHSLTIGGATFSSDRFGSANQAYKFTKGNYINVSDSNVLDIGNLDYSITLWAKIDSFCSTHMRMFSHGGRTPGNTPGYYFRVSNQVLHSEMVCSSSTKYLTSTTALTLNKWYFFAVTTTRNGNMVLYINGATDKTLSSITACDISNSEPATIATGYGASNAEYFCGSLEEINVYNKALSSVEIQQIYYSTSTLAPTLSPSTTPSYTPTSSPTYVPTLSPTSNPSNVPSSRPTNTPTLTPSIGPSSSPSAGPTNAPSPVPTSSPTIAPTYTPTSCPSSRPTIKPTNAPTLPLKNYANLDLATLNNNQGFAIQGGATNSRIAYSVNKAGDFDGDGFKDVIIGAPYESSDQKTNSGVSYIMFGNYGTSTNLDLAEFNNILGIKISGASSGDYSGWSVSSAGDFNGDGYSDVIIGAKAADGNSGIVYLVFGSERVLLSDINLATLDPSQAIKFYGLNSGSNLGISTSSLGDFNDDGYDDIIIGSIGVAYILFGNLTPQDIYLPNLNALQGIKIKNNEQSPISVGGTGNIDGDQFNDAIIGIYQASPQGRNQAGKSYVLYGKSDPLSIIDLSNLSAQDGFSISGAASGDNAGISVTISKSINGDEFDDIIIGAQGADTSSSIQDTGIVYAIWGKSSGFLDIDLANFPSLTGIRILGALHNDKVGVSVAGAGDINGDRRSDLIIGAPNASPEDKSRAGKTYIIFGKASFENDIDLATLEITEGFEIFGSKVGDTSGFSVAGVDDFNNDGYGDIIIGASNADDNARSNSGSAYVVYDVAATNSPTLSPTLMPTAPTLYPTLTPTVNPTSKPTSEPTISQGIEEWWNSPLFQILTSVISPVASIAAAWLFREKIAFYILNNWGYNYKCLYNKEDVGTGEIGFFLSSSKRDSSKIDLNCKIRDKSLLIEEDNGKNHGMPEKIYHVIVNELTEPTQDFSFLESEKNELLNFFLTRKAFINYNDLGVVKGFTYKMLINSDYKTRYEESRKFVVRLKENEFAQSDRDSESANPMTSIEMQNLDSGNNVQSSASTETQSFDASKIATNNKNFCTVMSVDALICNEYVTIQDFAFNKFAEVFSKEFNELTNYWLSDAVVLREKSNQALLSSTEGFRESSQYEKLDDFFFSIVNARQILNNIFLLKHLTHSTINYFGYNITLPEVLDHKQALIATDYVLGNAAAQLLPENLIKTGTVISDIGSAAFAIRLMAADYLKSQEPTSDPSELAMQCSASILLYNLPNLVTHAAVEAFLPGVSYPLTGFDVIATSSLGLIQCTGNYKLTQEKPTTADSAVPLIIDAGMLMLLTSKASFSASSIPALIVSIKNAMNIATTVYATDSVTRVLMDFVPHDVKQEYVEPICDALINNLNDGYKQISGLIEDIFQMDSEV